MESNKSGHFTCSQSTSKGSKSAICAELRQRLQPETWNPLGPQETVFANPRSTLEALQILFRGIHPLMTPNAAGGVPALISTGTLVTRERIGSTIPMPTFAIRPPTMSSFTRVDLPQSSMVGQQRQQNLELQFDKLTTPSSFCVLEDEIQNQSRSTH